MQNKQHILNGLLAANPNIFFQAFEAAANGIVITDNRQADNPIVYCNHAFELLTGYSFNEIAGRNCRFLQRDHDPEALQNKAIKEGLTNGDPVLIDIQNYRKDGSSFWNHLTISALRDTEGTIQHFIGTQENVSASKTAESDLIRANATLEQKVAERTSALEISENYQASIVETIRECLVVLDAELKIVSVNAQFCRLFRVETSEVVGSMLTTVKEGTWNIPVLLDLLNNILPTQNPFEDFEMKHDFKDLGPKWLLLNARQVRFKGQYQDRILLAIEDVTISRLHEQHRADFINITSHEIKTPLTSIKGHLQILHKQSQEKGSPLNSLSIEAALRSSARLEQTVKSLLEVAYIQSAEGTFNYEEVSAIEFFKQVIVRAQEHFKTHRIILSGQTQCTIDIDRQRIEQLVLHLIDNAVKFSPVAEQVDVEIRKEGKSIALTVRDHGIGIATEDQPLVFQRFFRSKLVETKFKGLGVGLFICKEIAEHNSGKITLKSSLGKGAEFTLSLPVYSD